MVMTVMMVVMMMSPLIAAAEHVRHVCHGDLGAVPVPLGAGVPARRSAVGPGGAPRVATQAVALRVGGVVGGDAVVSAGRPAPRPLLRSVRRGKASGGGRRDVRC